MRGILSVSEGKAPDGRATTMGISGYKTIPSYPEYAVSQLENAADYIAWTRNISFDDDDESED